jgi:peptide/nickel transport system ATP-binding protein
LIGRLVGYGYGREAADEPTAGLDVSVQAEVLNLVRRLRRELGMSYILITHNISLIRHVADQVAVMYMGRIVESGVTNDVMEHAAHPYAEGLIAAQPYPDPDRRRTEAPILGETPSLLKGPSGCEFRSRCAKAFDRCVVEVPPAALLKNEQTSRCWLAMPPSRP